MRIILIKSLFLFKATNIFLCPLTPQRVREDEIKLKTKRESEKEKYEKNNKNIKEISPTSSFQNHFACLHHHKD